MIELIVLGVIFILGGVACYFAGYRDGRRAERERIKRAIKCA